MCSAVNLPASKSTACVKREHTLTGHSNSEAAADDKQWSPYNSRAGASYWQVAVLLCCFLMRFTDL